MRYTFRTRLIATCVAALAVTLTPALLFAHARLVRSTPAANSTLATSPAAIRLWFSEQPELQLSAVELRDSAGTLVPLGAVTRVAGDPLGLAAAIGQPLAGGRYTVTWRTAAADGHASNGKFSFAVAASAAATPVAGPSDSAGTVSPTPAATAGAISNAIVHTGEPSRFSTSLRWVELVGVLTLVGSVIVRLFVVPAAGMPDPVVLDVADRARRLAMGALGLFIIATVTRINAESSLVGGSGGRLAAVEILVRGTRWGHGWLVGAVGAVVCLIGLFAARRARAGWMAAGLGVVAIALSEGLTGHAGAASRYLPLSIATDIAHVLGAGGWLGGLAVVLLAGLPALQSLNGSERARAGSRLLRAFHQAAMECVTIVVISAVIAAWLRVGSFSALWQTAYGQLLLIKIALVGVVLAFGFYHARTVVLPDWRDDTKVRFQRTAAFELLVGALVVAVTAVLVATALPTP